MEHAPQIRLDPESSAAPSEQLVQRVLELVASGALGAGAKLPSVRGLAAAALVNHNTVARAYRELEVLGVVRGENGRGVFVTDAGPRIAREQHGGATLAGFETAARAALRCGHPIEHLSEILRSLAATEQRRAS
ncbi:HTH-type transcriptional repressor YtrA [Planctomycetes bacterium Pla163]|uniref:HTH-type transcriptional repressor YtrA n=1 Tax=Rohdeia mirabilis TaxID=2528008 RepID=A0A518CW97_9BACT|nr:HTH-type transcriptional repressor YtrA [Planctomycetes bacterium Pla163]